MNIMKFFLNSEMIWHLLWIVPAFLLVVMYSSGKRTRLCRNLLGDRCGDPAYTTLSPGKRLLRNWLLALSLLLLIITAARPFWGSKILPFSGRGRDLIVVLDVSKSMLSQDVKPSRLDHAKWFLRELIRATPGDRYGIVAFSGSAFLECPLTIDKTSLFQILDELAAGSIPLGGTNIQNALKVALGAFEAAEGAHRAVILVTDGDELQGDMSKAADDLRKANLPLYVVGIGDPMQPGLVMVKDEDSGKNVFLKDSKGEIVKTRLNEQALTNLANSCSGIYVRSTTTSPCIEPVLAKIKGLVPEKYQDGQNTRPIERFQIPLLAAVLLLFAYMGIGEARRLAPIMIAAILISADFAFAQDQGGDEDAAAASNAEEPPADQTAPPNLEVPGEAPAKTAEPHDVQAAADNNGNGNTGKLPPEAIYNKALEFQANKDEEKAVDLYQKAINSTTDPEVRGKSFQNLGVMLHEKARGMMQSSDIQGAEKALSAAEEMYRQSLSSATKHREVALNQQKLINDRKIIEEIKKQQQQMQDKKNEAKDKIKDAMKENQKAKDQQNRQNGQQNQKQQKNDPQQQQGQQGQDKNDQQKDQSQKQEGQKDQQGQQGQDKKDQENEAKEKTEQAQKAVQDYKDEAQKKNSQNDSEAADKAAKELEKAKKEQDNKNFDKAEDNFKNALDALGKDEQEKNQSKDKGKEGKEEKKEEKESKQQEDQALPQPAKAEQDKEPKEESKIDEKQAEALIDLMVNDEKTLKDALKEMQRQNSRIKDVDKDW